MTNNAVTSTAQTSASQLLIGQISNVQLDNSSKPAWIESGVFVLRASMNGTSPQVSQFYARFTMIKTDGTSQHTHLVYKFQQANTSMQAGTASINGTATVTLAGSPVSAVPVAIRVFNDKLLAIWIGPDKINNHFGENPLYGTVSAASRGIKSEVQSLSNATISTAVGKNFTIALDSNPSTGYQWQVKNIDNSTTKLLNDQFVQPSSNLLGASGKQILAFQALKQGHTTIELQYVRPFQPNSPAMTYSVDVTVS